MALIGLMPACGGHGNGGTAQQLSIPIVSAWTRVDGGAAAGIGYSSSLDSNTTTGIALGGKVYLSWIEENASSLYQVRARVYNGNDSSPSFAPVDGGDSNTGLNVDPAQSAVTTPRLAVLSNKLYVAWDEPTATATHSHVSVYNGNDAAPAWTHVDGPGGGTGGIYYSAAASVFSPVVAANAGKLYAIWYEPGPGAVYQARVAVYNGNDSAPAWAMVDGNTPKGINFDNTATVNYLTLTSFAGKLYAAWSETLGFNLHVKVYNGNDSAPAWTFVDGNSAAGINHSASSTARGITFATSGNKLYALWTEQASGATSQIRAAVYNGNDAHPSWTFVDGNGANGLNIHPQDNAANPALAVYGEVLYASWKEQLGPGGRYGIHVAYYNGNDAAPAWTEVDQGNLSFSSTDNAELPVLIPTATRLYCAWDEQTIPGKGQIRMSSGM
jgi:hypothetical protein